MRDVALGLAAREVAETLERRGWLSDATATGRHAFATTGDVAEFARLGSRVFGESLGEVEQVALDELAALPGIALRQPLAAPLADPVAGEASCA